MELKRLRHLSVVLVSLFVFMGASTGGQSSLGLLDLSVILPARPHINVSKKKHQDASAYYKNRCVMCHGETGAGNGPMATHLNPRPRAFTEYTWQASMRDKDIAKTILQGGGAVGKSPVMPPHPDLKNKPELLKGLIQVVRAFGNTGTVRVKVMKRGGAGKGVVFKSAQKPTGDVAKFRFAHMEPGMYEITGYWEFPAEHALNEGLIEENRAPLQKLPFRQLIEIKPGETAQDEIRIKNQRPRP